MMIDRIETWNEASSVFEVIEEEMAKSLASQKDEIEKSLTETISREKEEAERKIQATEREFGQVRRVLSDHRIAMTEFHSAKDRLESQIKDHVGRALGCRDTLNQVSAQATAEWDAVQRLSHQLEEVRRRARETQDELRAYLDRQFGIQAPVATPFDTNSVPADLDDQVLTLEKIRDILASGADAGAAAASESEPGRGNGSRKEAVDSAPIPAPDPGPDSTPEPGFDPEAFAASRFPETVPEPGSAAADSEGNPAQGREDEAAAAQSGPAADDLASPETLPEEDGSRSPEGAPEGLATAEPEPPSREPQSGEPAFASATFAEPAPPSDSPETAPERATSGAPDQAAPDSVPEPADPAPAGRREEEDGPGSDPAAAGGTNLVGRLLESLERFRKTEPVVNGTGIEYFESDGVKVLDGEALVGTMTKVGDSARDLHAQLGGTESLKDLFLIKQEILNEQEVLRKVFFRVIKFCEKEGGSLPSYVREILNADILKDSLERLTMGNWSNDADFGYFMEEMSGLRNAFLAVTAGRGAYVRSILEQLGVEAN
jgi:hypothetical protein